MREFLEAKDSRNGSRMEAVLRRWLALEPPPEVLAKLDNMVERMNTSWWADHFFRAWASLDYAGAMSATDDDSRFANGRALASVEHQDPLFAQNIKPPIPSDGPLERALAALARDNPELVRGMAALDLPSARKGELAVAIARGLACDDPAAAFEWVRSLKLTPADAAPAFAEAFAAWCATDLDAAFAAYEAAGIDPAGFSTRNRGIELLLAALRNPHGARAQAQLARFNRPFLTLDELHRHLAETVVEWDGLGVQITPAIDRDGWYNIDAAGSAQAALRLPAGGARDALLKTLTWHWYADDPDAALEFAATHGIDSGAMKPTPSPQLRAAALEAPHETFAELFDPGRSDGNGDPLYDLAMEWAGLDPRAAAEWMLAIPESNGNLLLANTLGYHWAKHDAVEVSLWVESLPDRPAKTTAWNLVRAEVGAYSPDLVFTMSAGMIRDEARIPALRSALARIGRDVGVPAAMAYLQSPDIDETERRKLGAELESLNLDPSPSR